MVPAFFITFPGFVKKGKYIARKITPDLGTWRHIRIRTRYRGYEINSFPGRIKVSNVDYYTFPLLWIGLLYIIKLQFSNQSVRISNPD